MLEGIGLWDFIYACVDLTLVSLVCSSERGWIGLARLDTGLPS